MAFWDEKTETLGREKLEELQLERLKATVSYCYEKVAFYRRKFDSIGLKPEDIRSLSDLEKIPFTTKEDLRSE